MTAETDLLPCPFCDHPAKMESRQPGGTGASGMEPHMRRAGCAVCNIWTGWTHPVSEWGKQKQHDDALREMLARQWNTRANLAELQREVEGLRAEVVHLTRTMEATTHLLESAAAEMDRREARAERLAKALRRMVGASYVVCTTIDPRGHRWCEAYLDEALPEARAALDKETTNG